MPAFGKFHAATLMELHDWSTLSRNQVAPVLKRFGIAPLGRKYPMLRVYSGVLGVAPSGPAEEDMLGRGLVRVSTVAEWVGMSSEALLAKLRAAKNGFPPLYVVGPKRHLMLRAQVEQMLSSPRNAWQTIDTCNDHALPASRLARALKISQGRIDALLECKNDLPAHVITEGRIRYIVADVACRLDAAASDKAAEAEESLRAPEPAEGEEDTPKVTTGGLFAAASKQALHDH